MDELEEKIDEIITELEQSVEELEDWIASYPQKSNQ